MSNRAPRPAALGVVLLLVAQTTGGADLAPMLAPAARPGMLPPQGLVAGMPAKSPAPGPRQAPARPGRPWTERLSGFLADVAAGAEDIAALLDALSETGKRRPAFPVTVPEDLGAGTSLVETEMRLGAPGAPLGVAMPAPHPEDRIFVTAGAADSASGFGGLIVASEPVAPAEAPPEASMPADDSRFSCEWVGARGLRARVSYLDPSGLTYGTDRGYILNIRGLGWRQSVSQLVPARLKGVFPVYMADDAPELEVEIENTSGRTWTNVRVQALQETFNANGGAGFPSPQNPVAFTIKRLGPGERQSFRGRFRLSRGMWEVNFEQTHLTVIAQDGSGKTSRVIDEPQAGIVDPPNL